MAQELNAQQWKTLEDLVVDICDDDEVLEDRDLDLFDAGVMDSLSFVELLVALCKAFDIKIAPTEVERDEVSTLNRIAQIVAAKL